MNAIGKLREAADLLSRSGVPDSAKEAEALLTEVLQISKASLYSFDILITPDRSALIDSLVARRAAGEPLHYLLGRVEFHGLVMEVGHGVLIPRPETELVVDEAIRQIGGSAGTPGLKPGEMDQDEEDWRASCVVADSAQDSQRGPLRILDLCTGSGCIALSLAKAFPHAIVYGVDHSSAALRYALQNARMNGIDNAAFIEGDLFRPLVTVSFCCIVSNPPYVPTGQISRLQREIQDHEPIEALDGGVDGLDFYHKILSKAPRFLDEDGAVVLEIGLGQANGVKDIARRAGFGEVRFVRDYSGIQRVMIARAVRGVDRAPEDS